MATHLRRLVVWAALLAGVPATAADGTGVLSGVALDVSDGKPLVGALVQLTGPALDAPRTLVSGDAGRFVVDALPPGAYTLTVARDGYQPFQKPDVVVQEGETVRVGAWLTPEGSPVEEVVVTGSRIPRKDVSTPAPVTIIDREQIERSGLVGLGEFLQRLPEQIGGLNAQMNDGNQGQVLFNLRGLDSRRTLVLVNGRRMVGGGAGAEAMVDLETIPLAAVERVEVMKDGASAIYGSDAIAGVVNVILKKRFEGTEVSATGGVSSRGDAETYDLSGFTGFAGPRGSVFVAIGYQEQRPVLATARSWSERGLLYDFNSRSVVKDGSWETPAGWVTIRNAATVCADPGAIANPVLRHACELYAAGGGPDFVWDPRAGAYRSLTGDDLYNYQEHTYLLTPARRLQLFTTGNYQLGPEVRAFYEASFVSRRSSRQFPAFPDSHMEVPADAAFNDLGTDVLVGKRMVEAGLRRYEDEVHTYRLVLGLDGQLGGWAGPLSRWRWELAYVWGRNASRDTAEGGLRKPQLDDAVGACSTPGCVPVDVMHGGTTLTDEQRRYVTFSGTAHGYMEQQVASAGVSGPLFDLWSNRPAGLAAGLELRRESGGYFPDPISAAGEAIEGSQPPVSGHYSSREGYAELSLPLVGQRLLVEDLELIAALRNVDYTTFGDNTSYKLGARWLPVRDVALRGTWSTAFRAPGILELYTGNAEAWVGGKDPCIEPSSPAVEQQCRDELGGALPTGNAGTQVNALMGGNPDLRPETAEILTAGLVLQPRWVKGLSVALDFWDIRVKNAVETLGAATILARCYTGDGSGADYCSRVRRDEDGNLAVIDDRYANIGEARTSGVDLAARATVPARGAGAFALGFDLTYLLRYRRTYPDGTVDDAAGTYDLKLLLPRWKWNASLGWRRGPIALTTEARYIGELDECGDGDGYSFSGKCSVNPQFSRTVSANLVFDVAGSYELKSGLGTTRLLLGLRNVFDSAPPKIYNADRNNSDPGYDYVGRYVWGRVTQAF